MDFSETKVEYALKPGSMQNMSSVTAMSHPMWILSQHLLSRITTIYNDIKCLKDVVSPINPYLKLLEFQRRTVPSREPVINIGSSGWEHTALTLFACPSSVSTQIFFCKSQICWTFTQSIRAECSLWMLIKGIPFGVWRIPHLGSPIIRAGNQVLPVTSSKVIQTSHMRCMPGQCEISTGRINTPDLKFIAKKEL